MTLSGLYLDFDMALAERSMGFSTPVFILIPISSVFVVRGACSFAI
jgi:hypothetical protein